MTDVRGFCVTFGALLTERLMLAALALICVVTGDNQQIQVHGAGSEEG